MVVNGYYVWYKDKDGRFTTEFFPTSNYKQIAKYFDEHDELTLLSTSYEPKRFYDSEKIMLLEKLLLLNNL